ncbi:imidazoleglycerol-phosphate dehydratase [Lasallia pustulata]|uniref:Imidazoleglycerol-phosphate dehydratase n=1 Tax=Lasallia pustulata TaxID=136370 RepID=A0A1W5CYA2_9LECA|nr:imidazoleglycerol-phosphate dehydratase [Lasallia pustulata]
MAMSTLSLPARKALINRDTVETKIQVSLSIDGGPLEHLPSSAHFPERNDKIPHQSEQTHASQSSPSQQIWVWTGIGFLDHMLHALAKHAGWSLRIRSKGDLYIDDHHTTEDTFLALGAAFNKCLGDRTGVARFGDAKAPLDEALSSVTIDLSNRPFFVGNFGFKDQKIGDLSTQMIHHGLQSWSQAASVTLHVNCEYGDNDHHRAESAFKAMAVAIKKATERVKGREGEVISTKGVL